MNQQKQPKQKGSGQIRAKTIKARDIIAGVKLEGALSDETIRAALETLDHLNSGDVIAKETLEVSGEIITGFRYLNPHAPDKTQFLAELADLRRDLAAITQLEESPPEAADALESLEEAIDEAQSEKPRSRRIVSRLRETVGFISDAGKALDAAGKAGPLILKAIPVATGLYHIAQTAAQAIF